MSFWETLFGKNTGAQSAPGQNNQSEMQVDDVTVDTVADQSLQNESQTEPEQVVLPMDGIETSTEEVVVAPDLKVVDDEERRKQESEMMM